MSACQGVLVHEMLWRMLDIIKIEQVYSIVFSSGERTLSYSVLSSAKTILLIFYVYSMYTHVCIIRDTSLSQIIWLNMQNASTVLWIYNVAIPQKLSDAEYIQWALPIQASIRCQLVFRGRTRTLKCWYVKNKVRFWILYTWQKRTPVDFKKYRNFRMVSECDNTQMKHNEISFLLKNLLFNWHFLFNKSAVCMQTDDSFVVYYLFLYSKSMLHVQSMIKWQYSQKLKYAQTA